MKVSALNEQDAFRQLQKLASHKRMTLIEMTQSINQVEGAFDIIQEE